VYELNHYLLNGKFQEAENNLKLALENEPDNKQLHFSLGVVYDNLGDSEKAIKAYEDAIAIDSDYFDAIYNLGALYFNKGVEMNNAANDITDNKKYAEAREEAKQVFIKSKPYLEKAHGLDESDLGAIQSLSQLYALLNETENYQAMKAKLEKAGK
jgi:tetratricopeptide (TPR) repeat protein